MAYNKALAGRMLEVLQDQPGLSQKKMFGGLALMVNGNMCCGVNGEQLMLRVGADAYQTALDQPHAREMDFTGRAMKGMVYVDPPGFETREALAAWLQMALDFVASLPPK